MTDIGKRKLDELEAVINQDPDGACVAVDRVEHGEILTHVGSGFGIRVVWMCRVSSRAATYAVKDQLDDCTKFEEYMRVPANMPARTGGWRLPILVHDLDLDGFLLDED